jgi:hypothetical protein
MQQFADYAAHGWKLCAIERGLKLPRYAEWNIHPIPADACEALEGAGLLHALSGTCAIDIDDLARARTWLAERGVDLDQLMAADDAVMIESGRHNRAKLIYSLDKPMASKKVIADGGKDNIIDFRCATIAGKSVQDVLPPTMHPDTKRPYAWKLGMIGDWKRPPGIPAKLLQAWRELADPIAEDGATTAAAPPEIVEVDRLRAILAKHDPDMDYLSWIKVGMALHHECKGSGVGLAVWNEWSKRASGNSLDGSPKYKGVADLKTHWGSFSSGSGKRVVTTASLEKSEPATRDEFEDVPDTEVVEARPEPKVKRVPRIGAALNMQTSGKGKLVCNLHNAELMVRNMVGNESIELTFDEFLQKKMVRWPNEDKRRPWQDIDTITLQVTLQAAGLQTITDSATRSAAERVAHATPTNVVRDWLNSLQWDGVRRLSHWLTPAFGVPDQRYYHRTGRNWLISMVARAMLPGCKVDSAIVLEGPQGLKKSTAFIELVPEGLYYELIAPPDSKDCEQQLRGVWLGEFPEAWFMDRASVGRVKQFVTNRVDRYRPSYGREEIAYPRRCVFVAGTNENQYLKDPTGGRRFYPVECVAIDIPWIRANRDQLFAEAAVAYQNRRSWWHWPKLEANEKQMTRTSGDPWAQLIETNWEQAAQRDPATDRMYVEPGMIMNFILSIAPERQTTAAQSRVCGILRSLGFTYATQRRINGKPVRPWYAPTGLETAADPLLQ